MDNIEIEKAYDKKNILVIGDLHLPFTEPGYLQWCIEQRDKWDCGTIIFIGDIADFHYSSFHPIEPEALGCETEYEKMLQELSHWQTAFPEAMITYGNHDLIPYRKGYAGGLSSRMMKSWRDLFNAPKGWVFNDRFIIDNVLYTHGTNSAIPRMVQARISVVQGHLHSQQYCHWSQSEVNRLFAMQVGCGIDADSWAFNYGKSFPRKPVLGCGVVLESGTIPMVLPYVPINDEDK